MAISYLYPTIDFSTVDYINIPNGAYLIAFDTNNSDLLSKIDNSGNITVVEGGGGGAGSQGAQGAQGTQGAQGNQGAQGAQGNQGAQGDQGAQGNQGDQGDQGDQGSPGGEGIISKLFNYYNFA